MPHKKKQSSGIEFMKHFTTGLEICSVHKCKIANNFMLNSSIIKSKLLISVKISMHFCTSW